MKFIFSCSAAFQNDWRNWIFTWKIRNIWKLQWIDLGDLLWKMFAHFRFLKFLNSSLFFLPATNTFFHRAGGNSRNTILICSKKFFNRLRKNSYPLKLIFSGFEAYWKIWQKKLFAGGYKNFFDLRGLQYFMNFTIKKMIIPF